jgi:hypothetical protein
MFWVYSIPYIFYMACLIVATFLDVKEFRGPAFLGTFIVMQTAQVILTLILQPMAIRQ